MEAYEDKDDDDDELCRSRKELPFSP